MNTLLLRRSSLAAWLALAGAAILSAQAPTLEVQGVGRGGRLGASAAFVGDVNGDGYTELCVGRPGDAAIAGQIAVISGRDGRELWRTTGAVGALFGHAVAAAGDVDRDGVPDVIVGAPGDDRGGANAGAAAVFSGNTGRAISYLQPLGATAGDEFGWSVAGVGDLDLDGHDDVAVGAWKADLFLAFEAGSVAVFSGRDGSVLQVVYGSTSNEHAGASVCGISDLDGDGRRDLVVGSTRYSHSGLTEAGRVVIHGGLSGRFIRDVRGRAARNAFGHAVCAVGDVGPGILGDGVEDFVVGAPGVDIPPFGGAGGPDYGAMEIVSGVDGASLYRMLGEDSGDELGTSVAAVGDLDGDNRADVAVGAPQAAGRGKVYVVSGRLNTVTRDYGLLRVVAGQEDGERFGHAVAGGTLGLGSRPDPFADFAAGAPDASRAAGALRVFDGIWTSATVLGTPADHVGTRIERIGDYDGDGHDDFAASGNGHVEFRSGRTLNYLFLSHVGPFDFSAAESGVLAVRDQSGVNLCETAPPPCSGAWYSSAHAVQWVGDTDGDGWDDLLLVERVGGQNRVYLISGRTEQELASHTGLVACGFGNALAALGDVDADGFDDFAIGAPGDYITPSACGGSGLVYVYSGRDPTVPLYTSGSGFAFGYGYDIAGVGDLDGDGRDDYLVGTDIRSVTATPTVYLQSGAPTFPFLAAFSDAGPSVAHLGDLNRDGFEDFGLPMPGSNDWAVRSGVDFTLLAIARGGRHPAALGDIDGDGYPEFGIGDPEIPVVGATGRIDVYDLDTTGRPAYSRSVGGSCDSSNGWRPRARVRGRPALGESFAIKLRGALPGAPSSLMLSVPSPAQVVPGTGCAVFGNLGTAVFVPRIADPVGMVSLPLPVPANPALLGGTLSAQWLIVDAAKAGQLATSQGIELTIGQ
ncbi:MAG: VCBS repeat-containing protein [Planctomycetota bacterium]